MEAALSLVPPLIEGTTLQREAIQSRLELGYLDATVLMEYLIQKDIPQRTAHGIVGRLVRKAMESNLPLASLPLISFQEVHDGFDDNVFAVLGAKNAVAAMKSYGSTAPSEVRKQIDGWKEKIGREQAVV